MRNFREDLKGEVPRKTLLGTWVNKGQRYRGRDGPAVPRPFLCWGVLGSPHTVTSGLMFWLRRKRLSGS
jgi:hypothetical protein